MVYHMEILFIVRFTKNVVEKFTDITVYASWSTIIFILILMGIEEALMCHGLYFAVYYPKVDLFLEEEEMAEKFFFFFFYINFLSN